MNQVNLPSAFPTLRFGDIVVKLATLSLAAIALLGLVARAVAFEDDVVRLTTRWAADVSPNQVHDDYPRPQLRRESWQSLNGLWEYAIQSKDAGFLESYDGDILVPFPVESSLSGVQREVGPEKTLWYRRQFVKSDLKSSQRLLLHFGAVDWRSTVWINGEQVGNHLGGYDAFTFDITKHVTQGENTIVVRVWDPTDAGYQPRGKQVQQPHGIWYTAVTGIWQSVWLESTPATYIQSIRITPDVDNSTVTLSASCIGEAPTNLYVEVLDAGREVAHATGPSDNPITLNIPNAKLWSPNQPHLYDVKLRLATGDTVTSYLGMRKIEVRKDNNGTNRLFLNNKALFQFGLLDQGWWPDGLYTAPSDEALRYDLDITKKLGFNMVRKHVKVEPARWYYWCDKLGLLVWQDMPSGDKYISGNDPDIIRSKESAQAFERELKAMVSHLYNHPSIVMWVPYNEGWGQWDTARICRLIKNFDPTRLINSTSGWTDRGVGDVLDVHAYPGPAIPHLEEERAVVLGEFGGLGLPFTNHTWQEKENWGYRNFSSKTELADNYRQLIERLRPLVVKGLSAAVYTQTTDVEIEVNGVITYDRAIVKLPAEIEQWNRQLYEPIPKIGSSD